MEGGGGGVGPTAAAGGGLHPSLSLSLSLTLSLSLSLSVPLSLSLSLSLPLSLSLSHFLSLSLSLYLSARASRISVGSRISFGSRISWIGTIGSSVLGSIQDGNSRVQLQARQIYPALALFAPAPRSEERRVGKECRL